MHVLTFVNKEETDQKHSHANDHSSGNPKDDCNTKPE